MAYINAHKIYQIMQKLKKNNYVFIDKSLEQKIRFFPKNWLGIDMICYMISAEGLCPYNKIL